MNAKRTWLLHLVLIVASLVVAFPILFALVKSTQIRSVVLSPSLLPGGAFFENVRNVFLNANLLTFMRNSFIVAIAVTVGKTVLSLMAGMALVYFRFPFKRVVFALILFTLMIPIQVLVVPLFDVISLQPPETWTAFYEWIRRPDRIEPWQATRLRIASSRA